jgi:hypothetical protein
MGRVLIVLLVLLVVGALPVWPYSATWGEYFADGGLALTIVVMLLIFRPRRAAGNLLISFSDDALMKLWLRPSLADRVAVPSSRLRIWHHEADLGLPQRFSDACVRF